LPAQEASEAAQAAWAKGWEYRHQLRDPGRILSWLNTVAINMYRGVRRRAPVLGDLPEVAVAPRVNLAAIDAKRLLARCSKRDRLMLEAVYMQDMRAIDIARHQGWNESSTRVRLARARARAAALIGSNKTQRRQRAA
jgi:DNA-directed RNA polymerase specialized sigma24 family protein